MELELTLQVHIMFDKKHETRKDYTKNRKQIFNVTDLCVIGSQLQENYCV